MVHKKNFRYLFLPILLTVHLYASQSMPGSDTLKTYLLKDVVVSATKTTTPAIQIGSTVTVINREEIERSQKGTVLELLQDVPGVSITQQGGPGKLATVFMRGAGSDHTMVLLDGVEMNNPGDINNVFDFANLQSDEIERIEILRGPQSTLYGSDALAGVIAIFTKKPSQNFSATARLEGGSYQSFRSSASVSGSFEGLTYSLIANKFKTKGFSSASELYGNTEPDGYSTSTLAAKFGYAFSDELSFSLLLHYNKAATDYDYTGGVNGDDPNYSYSLQESAAKASITSSLFDKMWSQSLSFEFMRNFRKYTDGIDAKRPTTSSDARYDGSKKKVEWLNTLRFLPSNVTSVGIDAEEELAVSDYYSNGMYGPFDSFFPRAESTTFGIYAQDQITVIDQGFLTIGTRYDKHKRFGNVTTYRIAPAYFISETGTKFRATFGTGFKAPSLFNLYDPGFGNATLKPERSKGWDAGVEQFLLGDRLSLELTYFSNQFSDLFSFDNATFKTINLAKAKTNGIELSLKYKAAGIAETMFTYTMTNSKDKSEGSSDYDQSLLRRPQDKASLSALFYLTDRITLGTEILYTGLRDDKDFSAWPAQRIQLQSYTLVNLTATYLLHQGVQTFFKIHNAFDTKYEEILGYGTERLSVYGGISLTL